MTQDKREKTGVKTNFSSAKSKTNDQRAKKKLSATLLSLLEAEDELCNIHWDSVPLYVQKWLTSTFIKEKACENKPKENISIRTISPAAQSCVWKEKRFHIPSSPCGLAYPEEVIAALKDLDQWSFNVFALSEASGKKSLKFMMCELFCKYNLLSQFKIPLPVLISFAEALEAGYNKYQNSYHNSIHAADVAQTVHSFILHTGMMHWFSDLEILALIFSASIHDYEHTGTTNYFHIQTRSEAAFLYNDISILENHHVSAVYKLMQNQEMNILANLTEVQWRELRQLVITMVLSTDISQHFQHMSSMRQALHCLQQRERPNKLKVMCMILHAADMSHPSKAWALTYQWAEAVMEEFFKQGDKEAELGMPVSTFCDRKTTSIAECQLAFIDIIVQPAFTLLFEVVEKIVAFLKNEASKPGCFSSSREHSQNSEESKGQDKDVGNSSTEESGTHTERHTLIIIDIPRLRANLIQEIEANRKKWKETTKEELVDNESSWKKAAGQNVDANIQEMRGMVPKSKPLGPNESDDVIIEEVIPDDPQAQPTSQQPTITGQDGAQHPPNTGCITTNLTQSDMEIFSLWNEELMRRAAEQKKQQEDKNRKPPDAALQEQVKQNEDSQRKEGCPSPRKEGVPGCPSPATFILQVISIDAPSVTCEIEGSNRNPCQQEVINTPNQTTANASQQTETTPCGDAAVSVTSLNYGVFKIPQ
ncbi:hypothetical protein lerEdw1_018619 [Lerista edwardsae]|nr:hypothetical protein lerEdw1_018619 [Lerista edwardsae]